MTQLRFLEAHTETHFKDMSLLHALGWRAAYHDLIPKDYLDREILDDHWVPFFHDNCGTGKLQGLILYNGEHPLCCGVYGPVRDGASAQRLTQSGPVGRAGFSLCPPSALALWIWLSAPEGDPRTPKTGRISRMLSLCASGKQQSPGGFMKNTISLGMDTVLRSASRLKLSLPT